MIFNQIGGVLYHLQPTRWPHSGKRIGLIGTFAPTISNGKITLSVGSYTYSKAPWKFVFVGK